MKNIVPIPRHQIDPDPGQPRKTFPDPYIQELAASIATHGLLQPPIVRPHPEKPGRYMLILGECRWRASGLAKLDTLPCLIRSDLSPAQVLEWQIIENLQRADLNVLEEALGFHDFLKTAGGKIEHLCERLKKSRTYIFSRLKLLDLPAPLQAHLRSGAINHSVALLLARIPDPKAQAECAKWVIEGNASHAHDPASGKWVSVTEPHSERQVAAHIAENYMRRLTRSGKDAGALFPLDDEKLAGKPSCLKCPHRTGNMLADFPDLKKSPDVCTHPGCFKLKLDAFWNRTQTQARKNPDGPRILDAKPGELFENYNNSVRHGSPYIDLGADCYETCGAGINGSAKPWRTLVKGQPLATHLARDHDGNIRELARHDDAKRAAKANGHKFYAETRSGISPTQKTPAQKRAERAEKIQARTRQIAMGALIEKIAGAKKLLPDLEAALLRRLCTLIVTERVQIYDAYERTFNRRGIKAEKGKYGAERQKPFLAHLASLKDTASLRALLAELLLTMDMAPQNYTRVQPKDDQFLGACQDFGIGLDIAHKQAESEIPPIKEKKQARRTTRKGK